MTMKAMRARAESLSIQSVDQEVLIMDHRTGMIHQLNQTATLIWRKCAEGVPLEELVKTLAENYDIAEDIARGDVETTVQKLQALNLLSEVE